MKLFSLLPLAALGTTFVIVDDGVFNQIAIESKDTSKSFLEQVPSKDDVVSYVEDTIGEVAELSKNALDRAFHGSEAGKFQCHESMTAFDPGSWLSNAVGSFDDESSFDDEWAVEMEQPDAFKTLESMEVSPKKPHRRPHHKNPHRHHKPNLTIWELISKSKYTTKLAKLVGEFDDLVEILNGTSSNITLFAPTDAAFKKIPDHHKKPSKELIRNVLAYHVSPGFYPARRVLATHTIPSAYSEERLGGEAQRLRVGFGLFKGLNINFYSKIVAADIFATNGVIHGVDHLILPPPPALKIIELLPGEFSTLQLGLVKTGLFSAIKDSPHTGGTLFAPSNFAFKKLGPKINAFLFSKYGEKYLKALLEYHVVANETLYSDAFYKAKEAQELFSEIGADGIPKGRFHVDLPTLLDGKSLSIDIARFGGLITIKINGFGSVAVQDGLASDGVIHVVSNVLIPPKTPGGVAYQGEELTVEEFKERLDFQVKQKGWWEL